MGSPASVAFKPTGFGPNVARQQRPYRRKKRGITLAAVPSPSKQPMRPRERVEAEAARRGKDAFVAGCMKLLSGHEADADLIVALGGGPARWAVQGSEPGPDYWLRVWAARGLLWVWDDKASSLVLDSLRDDAWRVREMTVKVAARHRLTAAAPVIADLRTDKNARVRATAERAAHRLA